MISPINLALSGMNAAVLRLSTSANNVANVSTTSTYNLGETKNKGPFVPKDVVQVNQGVGGTYATVVDSSKEPLQVYDQYNPEANANGIVSYPNVDTNEEIAGQIDAGASYKANLKAIEIYKQMNDAFLDIFA